MKTIKLVLLLALTFNLIPSTFANSPHENEVVEAFDVQESPEFEEKNPKKPLSFWQKGKKIVRKYPKTVFFSSAALIAIAILINQRLNAKAPGTPDISAPPAQANQSGPNVQPFGRGRLPI